MQRTIRVRLHTTAEQRKVLAETSGQFTRAFNMVAAYGWAQHEKNGVRLHHATYYQAKAEASGLVSDLVIQARVKATEALASAFTRLRNGRRTSQPRSKFCPPRYNLHTYSLDWDSETVALSVVGSKGKRLRLRFTLPAYATKYHGCDTDSADLILRNGKWYLHIVVTVPDVEVVISTETIGVDLGISHPAVTSKRKFYGTAHWKEVDRRYFRIKRSLQSKGTKSATHHLRKLVGKQMRFHRDCDHVLSRRIVDSASAGATIVIENLTEIRSRVRQRKGQQSRRLHSWTFAQLRSFLTYKGAERGIHVVAIDPRHTSQTCSRCGYTHKSNRKSQSLFLCRSCGYELNADLNASYNIRNKHLASVSTSFAGGLPSNSLSSQSSQVL
jgi:putative transposase